MVTSRLPHWLAVAVPLGAVVLGWFATASWCEVAGAEDPAEVRWVRTADGWERAGWIHQDIEQPTAPIHPAVVAAAMFVLSAACLIAGHARGKSLVERGPAIAVFDADDRL